MRVLTLFDSFSRPDGRTAGRTDGRTGKGSDKVACRQLKKKNREEDRETWNGRGGDRLLETETDDRVTRRETEGW